MPNKSLVSCSSLPVHHVSPSTGSRISRDRTDLADSPSRSRARRPNYPSRILVSTVWIFRHTSRLTLSTRSSHGPWRKPLDSARSKQHSHLHRDLLLVDPEQDFINQRTGALMEFGGAVSHFATRTVDKCRCIGIGKGREEWGQASGGFFHGRESRLPLWIMYIPANREAHVCVYDDF